jgi:hypothetical protein
MHRATTLKDVDVVSQMRAQKGVEAQGKIFEGTLPIGVSILVSEVFVKIL